MSKVINENTNFTFDLKTIALVIGFFLSLSATYFTLKADIEEAKELPLLPITEKEFQLKDELIRSTIMSNAKRLEKIETYENLINELQDFIIGWEPDETNPKHAKAVYEYVQYIWKAQDKLAEEIKEYDKEWLDAYEEAKSTEA